MSLYYAYANILAKLANISTICKQKHKNITLKFGRIYCECMMCRMCLLCCYVASEEVMVIYNRK
jgi:hypothetical protein